MTPLAPEGISAEQSTSTKDPVVPGVLLTALVKKLRPLPKGDTPAGEDFSDFAGLELKSPGQGLGYLLGAELGARLEEPGLLLIAPDLIHIIVLVYAIGHQVSHMDKAQIAVGLVKEGLEGGGYRPRPLAHGDVYLQLPDLPRGLAALSRHLSDKVLIGGGPVVHGELVPGEVGL